MVENTVKTATHTTTVSTGVQTAVNYISLTYADAKKLFIKIIPKMTNKMIAILCSPP